MRTRAIRHALPVALFLGLASLLFLPSTATAACSRNKQGNCEGVCDPLYSGNQSFATSCEKVGGGCKCARYGGVADAEACKTDANGRCTKQGRGCPSLYTKPNGGGKEVRGVCETVAGGSCVCAYRF